MKLDVDGFEIDLETLYDATGFGGSVPVMLAKGAVVEEVIKNLDIESKKVFRLYQEQNNPCR